MNWTEEEYQTYTQKKLGAKMEQIKQKANKYNVAAKEDRTYNGIVFDSKAEMKRYIELQPVFELQPPFEKDGVKYRAIKYKADFSYYDRKTYKKVIEDVKGHKTKEYQIKKKLLLKRYPAINFVEVS